MIICYIMTTVSGILIDPNLMISIVEMCLVDGAHVDFPSIFPCTKVKRAFDVTIDIFFCLYCYCSTFRPTDMHRR